MKPTPAASSALAFASLSLLFAPPAPAQEAETLDVARAREILSAPYRNPVKSSSPVVKRTHERRADKGLEVETAAPVDVEVLHRADGSTEERPCVPLPILFVRTTDQFLDETSRRNVDAMASILAELSSQDAKAHFEIQGHTSSEGPAAANQALSERRAARIRSMFLAKGVDAAALSMVGLGEDCARAPESAPEHQRQLDRRVLIVRTR